MRAYLVLQDGSVYVGRSRGANCDCYCEVVFTTGMAGYVETLTDPSFFKQGVVLTYPIIGNYGVNLDDMESDRIWMGCLIVRELSDIASNFRSQMTINEFLLKYNIPAIEGVDTRAITKKIRDKGTMAGFLTTKEFDMDEVLKKLRDFRVTGAVAATSAAQVKHMPGAGKRVALYDFGTKKSIPEYLNNMGFDVTIYPYNTPAETVIASKPDGIMLSNGPGDPKDCPEAIAILKKLYQTDIPIFGICLGHQLFALATGADTVKLPFGHRGENHPVKDLETGVVYITSQNHGYVISSIDENVAAMSHMNINDSTLEGLHYKNKNIRTVQFHPEASPGPRETGYLFETFAKMMGGNE
ncbi:MAG: carbamoyl phosphate synthase small subunit [Clostridia bacterium]|nr:carbamoyl phosphate synthase small subunit [Clostridia bacterium]